VQNNLAFKVSSFFLSRLLILAAGQNKKATLIFQGKEEKMN